MAAESVAATSSQRLHPALAALHSLLLPPLLYPQAFEHLKIDTPKGKVSCREELGDRGCVDEDAHFASVLPRLAHLSFVRSQAFS